MVYLIENNAYVWSDDQKSNSNNFRIEDVPDSMKQEVSEMAEQAG